MTGGVGRAGHDRKRICFSEGDASNVDIRDENGENGSNNLGLGLLPQDYTCRNATIYSGYVLLNIHNG